MESLLLTDGRSGPAYLGSSMAEKGEEKRGRGEGEKRRRRGEEKRRVENPTEDRRPIGSDEWELYVTRSSSLHGKLSRLFRES